MTKALLIVLLLGLPFIVNAQRASELNQDEKEFLNNFGSRMFIPPGSKTEILQSSFLVSPPKGWQYIFKTLEEGEEKVFMKTGNAGVSCDCTINETGEVGGCHAQVSNQGAFACIMREQCNACVKKVQLKMNNNSYAIEFGGSGYVNLTWGIGFMSYTDTLPLGFPLMKEILQIQEAMTKFETSIYDNMEKPVLGKSENGMLNAPTGYTFAGVSVYGRAFILLVPEDKVPEGKIKMPTVKCGCEIDGNCDPFPDGLWITCYSTCTGACNLVIKETFSSLLYNY